MSAKKVASKKAQCIDLVNEIAKLFKERMRQIGPDTKAKPTYQAILRVVADNPGLSQLKIAEEVRLAPPTISITLQKMERDGLISREVDRNDLRQMRVSLTEKGEAANKLLRANAMTASAAAGETITEEEFAVMIPILTKMRDNLVEANTKA